MKHKGLYTGIFLIILLLLMASSAFAELSVYEENFADTIWDGNSMIVETSLLGLETEAVETDDGVALKVTGASDDSLGTGKFVGKAFVADLEITDTSKVYIYTQRVKFEGTPAPTFNMSFTDGLFHDGYAFYVGAKDGKYVFASSGSSGGMASAKAVEEGWHTLVSKIFYNTGEAKYDFVTTVYNESGTKVWERLIRGTTIASAANPRKITYMFNNLGTQSSVYVADAKLYVTSGAGGTTLSESDVERNCSAEIVLTNGMDLNKISMKNSDGSVFEDYEIVKTSPYTAKIATTELLGKNSQYTIDFDDSVGLDDFTFTTKSQYVLDAELSGVIDGKNAMITYNFNDNSGIKKINCRMMGFVYEDGKMTDVAITEISSAETNVNTELTAELIFNENIGENAQISIVFFENGAYIPMSTGIALK